MYGGIYVVGYVMALFLQGTVGYTALAAGLAGIPGYLLLGLFSERFGVFAGRYGPRRFMVMGPAVMALGILWLGRFPADSQPWRLVAGDPSSWLPPTSYLTDVLPAMLIYGFGLTMLVAPLTTALMGSVPVERAGLASAINNAVSRVGPQLAGAAIFIAITAVFYAQLAVVGSLRWMSTTQTCRTRWHRSTRRPTVWRPTSPRPRAPLPPTRFEWPCGSRPG